MVVVKDKYRYHYMKKMISRHKLRKKSFGPLIVSPKKVTFILSSQRHVDFERVYRLLIRTGKITGSRNKFLKQLIGEAIDEYIFKKGIFFTLQ